MLDNIFGGNDFAKNQLLSEASAPPHAVLLFGEKGLGKTHFAKLLACRLLATPEDYRAHAAFFEEPAAKLVFAGLHPDLTTISGEGAAIKVEEIRAIGETIHLRPNQSEGKVYLILQADKMTPQAQNALLKLLEDPPGHATFVLTARSQYSFLETILSRVWAVELRPVAENVLRQLVAQKRPGLDPEMLDHGLTRFPGNIGQVLSYLDRPEDPLDDLLEEVLAGMEKRSAYLVAAALEPLKKDRAQVQTLLDQLAALIALALLPEAENLPWRAKELGERVSPAGLYHALEALKKMEQQRVFNPNLQIECARVALAISGCGEKEEIYD